ncbi:hypothetical protein ODD08_004508, partial [Salmonella enterica]|nr:hypothetical protein [Salmonella enterica]
MTGTKNLSPQNSFNPVSHSSRPVNSRTESVVFVQDKSEGLLMKKLVILSVLAINTFCHSAYAGFNTPTAFGDGATAGTAGTAVGNEATASAGGIAIGSLSYAGANNSIYIGGAGGGYGAYAEGSIAIGTVSKTTGKYSIALGVAANASGTDSMALGYSTKSSAANSVALGADSVADRDNTISIGNKDTQRQITNLAAGTADTDAVNVAQLNDTKNEMKGYTDNSINTAKTDMMNYTDNSSR